jgi:hypothetical protein
MMHAAFDSNRYSFAIILSLREQMPQAGPDDNRTFNPINSSRAANLNSINLFLRRDVFV